MVAFHGTRLAGGYHAVTTDPYRDASIPLPRLRSISQLWACAAVLAGLGVACLAIDIPLARFVAGDSSPGFLRKICGFAELFGHGIGVVSICVVIAVLDPWHRCALPRIAVTSLGAGLMANIFKLLIARDRPRSVDFTLIDRGLDTFGQWLPLASNASGGQGFPSSHTASAAALAIVLAAFYPRGRWLFPACAALAGLQRILSEAHFASDVLWGAALGCIFAPLCVYGSAISTAFDKLEEQSLARRLRSGRLMPDHPRPVPRRATPAA
jgi:membrane-associated phospholipid phosphatase